MSTPLHGPLDHWRTVYTICGHGIGQGLVFQKHSLQEQKMLRFHLSWGGPFSFLSFNGCCIIPVVFSHHNLYSARIPETDESDLPDGVRSTLLSQQHWDKPWQENIHGGRREMVKCTRCQHVKWPQTERFYLERATGRSSVECVSPFPYSSIVCLFAIASTSICSGEDMSWMEKVMAKDGSWEDL